MSVIPRSTALFAIGVAASLSLVGCGESKVSQCNKLTTAVNKSQSINDKYQKQLNALQQSSNLNNFNEAKIAFGKAGAIFKSFSGELKTVNQEFTSLNFNDDKLKDFYDRYLKLIGAHEKTAIDASNLFNKASKLPNEAAFSQLVPEIGRITELGNTNSQTSKKLNDEITTYCGAVK
jgi:hypothetical protein